MISIIGHTKPATGIASLTKATMAVSSQILPPITGCDRPVVESTPLGVDSWIRTFTVELGEKSLKSKQIQPQDNLHNQHWQIIADEGNFLTQSLQTKLQHYLGKGVIVCLSPQLHELQIELLLEGAKLALKHQYPLILVQHDGGYGAFARTFQQENPELITCVIDTPVNHPSAIDWVVSEILNAQSYTEVYYDSDGVRYIPQLQLYQNQSANSIQPPLTKDDLLLVTGGGKGIAAESALSLAKATGVKLALLGRSLPSNNQELAQNLQRIKEIGV